MGSISPVFGSIVPSQVQQALQSNYLAFNGGANDFETTEPASYEEKETVRTGADF